MWKISFLLMLGVAVAAFGQTNLVTIRSTDLLTPPSTLKGSFEVASKLPQVELIIFSDLPSNKKTELWSSWGNGLLASNGKYYTAIGDHGGYDGNSYVYEYDPAAKSLKKIVDIASFIGQKKGDYGHGKIHAPILEYQHALYFATYYGKVDLVPEALKKGYHGSLLFRYDLITRKLENLGAIAEGEGFPGAAIDASRGLLYFYGTPKGNLVAYDLKKHAVRFHGGSESTATHRSFILAYDGKLYFTNEKGNLYFYNPDANAILPTTLSLPGPKNTLRASTRTASNGHLWGMTESGGLFEFDPAKGIVKDLGPNFLGGVYTAVMLLSPDEKFLYFAPGAHGSALEMGTPVVQYEIATGKRKVVAFLRDAILKKIPYAIAGNYNLQISADGSTLFATFNGAKSVQGKEKQEKFGLPSVVLIHF